MATWQYVPKIRMSISFDPKILVLGTFPKGRREQGHKAVVSGYSSNMYQEVCTWGMELVLDAV